MCVCVCVCLYIATKKAGILPNNVYKDVFVQADAGFSLLLIEVMCFWYCGDVSKLLYPVPFN